MGTLVNKLAFGVTTTVKSGQAVQMEFPIFVNWISPFPFNGLLDSIFIFNKIFKGTFGKQTVEILIRRHVLRRLFWFCTVCLCPTNKTLGLYGWVKLLITRACPGVSNASLLEASVMRL